jgi:hypothetical protein
MESNFANWVAALSTLVTAVVVSWQAWERRNHVKLLYSLYETSAEGPFLEIRLYNRRPHPVTAKSLKLTFYNPNKEQTYNYKVFGQQVGREYPKTVEIDSSFRDVVILDALKSESYLVASLSGIEIELDTNDKVQTKIASRDRQFLCKHYGVA